jgi:hypothetical protein
MNDSQQLRDAMWDLVYGLLSDDESQVLIARIKSDPQAARLYAEVRLQADLVAHASRVEDSSITLRADRETTPAAAPREKRATPATKPKAVVRRSATWLVGMASTALAALLVAGVFWPRTNEKLLARKFLATDVVAQRSMPAGLTNQVTVRTYHVSHDGEPAEGASANLELWLLDRAGHEKFNHSLVTSRDGQATVEIPGNVLEPGVRLEVGQAITAATSAELDAYDGTTAAHGESRVKQSAAVAADLPVQAEPNLAYLLLSEPTPEPGKPVEYSLWNFRAFTAKPASAADLQKELDELTRFAFANPTAGRPAQEGVINGTIQLPANAVGEVEELALARGVNGAKPADGRTTQLAENEKAPVLRREAAELGENASVPADRLAGVRLQSESRSQLARSSRIAIPYFRMEGAPRAESAKEALPPGQAGQSAAVGGELQLQESLQRDSESIATVAAGAPIVVAVPTQLVGKPLTAAANCRGITVATGSWPPNDPALSRADESGASKKEINQISLPLPPEVDGLIEVAFFDRTASAAGPVQRQWVYREPQRKLQIELQGIKGRVAPGEEVKLTLRVTDENGQPAADTRVGVRVWNEQLVQQSAESPVLLADAIHSGVTELTPDITALSQERLAEQLALSHSVGQLAANRKLVRDQVDASLKQQLADQTPASGERDLKKLADAAQESLHDGVARGDAFGRHRAIVAPQEPKDAETPRGEKLNVEFSYGLEAPLVSSEPVELASNRAAVEAAFRQASAEAKASRQQAIATIGSVVMAGGILLLVFIGVLALRRMTFSARMAAPALAVAFASLLLGMVWVGPSLRGRVGAIASVDSTQFAANDEAAAVSDPGSQSILQLPASATPAAADNSLGAKVATDFGERAGATAESAGPAATSLAATPPPPAAPTGAPSGPPAGVPLPASMALQPAPPVPALRPDGSASAASAVPARPAVARGTASVADTKAKDALGLAPQGSALAANGASGRGGAQLGAVDADQDKAPVNQRAGGFGGGGAGRSAGGAAPPGGGALAQNPVPGLQPANKPLEKSLAGDLPTLTSPANASPPIVDGAAEAKGKLAAAPASLLFNPELTTDAQGRVTIRFVMPQVDSEYRLLIDALGQGRIGSRQAVITCGPEK